MSEKKKKRNENGKCKAKNKQEWAMIMTNGMGNETCYYHKLML